MSFTLKFGSQAGVTYQAVIAQLYERWSEKTALKFEEKVKNCLYLISENPLLHPLVDETLQLRNCTQKLLYFIQSLRKGSTCSLLLGQQTGTYVLIFG